MNTDTHALKVQWPIGNTNYDPAMKEYNPNLKGIFELFSLFPSSNRSTVIITDRFIRPRPMHS